MASDELAAPPLKRLWGAPNKEKTCKRALVQHVQPVRALRLSYRPRAPASKRQRRRRMRSSAAAIAMLVAVLLSLCVQPTEAVRPRTSAQRAARSASSPSGTPCAALPAACGEAS